KQVCIRVNAGPIPSDHWTQDPKVGGGRLIGEGCHFVDLAVALCGSLVRSVSAFVVNLPGKGAALQDSFTIALEMCDGSVASIFYSSIGDTGFAKERVEVYGGGRVAVIDDFRRLEMWQGGKRKTKSWSSQDKGQKAQLDAWVRGIRRGRVSIPLDEILNVHEACFAALRCIETGELVSI
ncbi:MAG: Gfo/Idh/MocA family protein, partial [Candidatus Udaeobacter sp.]